MSEDRFDRLEKMLELALREISTVKSTMATKEELAGLQAAMATKEDIAGLNAKIDTLGDRVGTLDTKVDTLDAKVNELDTKVDALDAKVEHYGQIQQDDVYELLKLMDKKLTGLGGDIKSLAEVTGDHEVRIRTLARRPV